jgi:hypothetical protein
MDRIGFLQPALLFEEFSYMDASLRAGVRGKFAVGFLGDVSLHLTDVAHGRAAAALL